MADPLAWLDDASDCDWCACPPMAERLRPLARGLRRARDSWRRQGRTWRLLVTEVERLRTALAAAESDRDSYRALYDTCSTHYAAAESRAERAESVVRKLVSCADCGCCAINYTCPTLRGADAVLAATNRATVAGKDKT